MSDKPKVKTTRTKAKLRIIMLRYYKPAEKLGEGQLDDLGRLPKGQMVEVPKKLGEQLIEKGIAVGA